MGDSAIEWTDKTWNPTVGCTRVSEGCRHCYAFELHDRRHRAHQAGSQVPAQYAKPFRELQLMEDRITDPLHWRKPCRVFVNSMSDLFHKDVPDEFIDRVFAVMALTPRHTFQVLTKRPERMRAYFEEVAENGWGGVYMRWGAAAGCLLDGDWVWGPGKSFRPLIDRFISVTHGEPDEDERGLTPEELALTDRPLPNVWLGTSVEDQRAADERIPLLLETPAAVRFLSCEPLLGPVDLSRVGKAGRGDDLHALIGWRTRYQYKPRNDSECGIGVSASRDEALGKIGWVIVGGESGRDARPCDVAWVRSVLTQCRAAGVACFVKQLGARPVSPSPLCPIDCGCGLHRGFGDGHGGDPAEWPGDLRVRQFPEVAR